MKGMKLRLVLPIAFSCVFAAALAVAKPPLAARAKAVAAGGSSNFIENAGQWDSRVQFLSQTNGLNLWITSEGPVFEFNRFVPIGIANTSEPITSVADPDSLVKLPGSSKGAKLPGLPKGYVKGHVVKMTFVNANPSAVTGQGEQKSKFNYFLGNDKTKWVSNARSYKQVTAEKPYDGISIRYTIDQGKPRYDVIVNPGADPSQVGIKIEGADDARILENGNLELKTSLGTVEERGLTAYQETPSGRTQVPCKMVMEGNTVHFDTGGYDPAKTLVIDPLVASTYLGGTSDQQAAAVALDASNNIYVAGSTDSINFPVTVGAFQSALVESLAFVSKLDPTETSLIYSAVFGGSNLNAANAIAVDASGNAFIGGITASSDFPVTNGAFQSHYTGGSNNVCFAVKLSASGSQLLYSTYVGGSKGDLIFGIGLDPSGNAVIAGTTASNDFPVTNGAFQTTNKVYTVGHVTFTGFVTKINSTGTGLVYSTYLGGSGNSQHIGDGIYSVGVDGSGDAVVCGASGSPDFPTTAGAYQTVNSETTDGYFTGFISKLNSSGTQLVFSTFLGGSGNVTAGFGESARCLALDSTTTSLLPVPWARPTFPPPLARTSQLTLILLVKPCCFETQLERSRLDFFDLFHGAGITTMVSAVAVDGAGDAILVGQTVGQNIDTDCGWVPGSRS